VTITSERESLERHTLHVDNVDGLLVLASRFRVCPNSQCRRPTLHAGLYKAKYSGNGITVVEPPLQTWRLRPESDATPFPDYVPLQIRQDYEEACLIADKSAKAAATLARRALQGVLRDFYQVKPGRLVDEIDAVEDKMDADLFEAVHGVRKIGNIGAHMEADINVIVDVDPDEAKLLIELVETVIKETYVRRDERRQRIKRVTDLAAEKDKARKQ
jgi:hypothetical protein